MGGNAFPQTARRINTAQHQALHKHALAALVPAFFPRAEALRDARDKADHGDLDLIAGWADERAWKLKGEERGEVDGGMGLGGPMAVAEGELGEWAQDMAKALKAKEWVRRGSEISFAIPCSIFDAGEGFYQLDVPFVPIDALDFYLVSVSYSTTFLVLARAVRCISPALNLQMIGLIIRHAAYPGIPGIDIVLTPSVTELADYLGLDLEKWALGFDSEVDCWRWLTEVKEGGMLATAYAKMVRPRAVRQKGHKKKAGGLDAFVAFLRTTKWGEGWEAQVQGLAPDVCAIPADMTANHPDRPVPLDERAEAALARWNKKAEYDGALAERRVDAAYLYERQQRRIENKRRAEALKVEKAVERLAI